MEFINSAAEFLNSESGAITTLTTICLAGITAWYTILTRIMVKNANMPYIRIYLYADRDRSALYLCIENIGNSFARDINFSTNAKLIPGDNRNPYKLTLGEIEPLKGGISYLNSGDIDMIYLLPCSPLVFESREEVDEHNKNMERIIKDTNANEPFKIKVNYKNLSNSKKSKTYDFHLGNKEHANQFSKPRLDNTAEELNKMNEILRALNQHFFRAHITQVPPTGYHLSNLSRIADALEKLMKHIDGRP